MSNVYSRKNAVALLVKKFGLPKRTADQLLLEVFDDMSKALKKGHRVQLHPFGSFEVTKRKARKGRNPATGESIKIPAKKVVKFKSYAGLKETLG
jgi:DNA-binding protein HU-beta